MSGATVEYRHTSDMGEISGFGGGYEKCCQDMLEAGAKWLAENAERRDMRAHGFKDVYGILIPDSDDAKALEAAALAPVAGQGATGAMVQAVMMRLFFIAKNGWDEYCSQVRASEAEGAAS